MELEFSNDIDQKMLFFLFREYFKNSYYHRVPYLWKHGSEGIKELIFYKREIKYIEN